MIWNETFVPKPKKNLASDDFILNWEDKDLKFIYKGIKKESLLLLKI